MENVYEREIVNETVVDEEPSIAYDIFFEYLWWGGGGLGKPSVIEQGDSIGKGSIRCVTGGIHEEVLEAEHGKFIQYTLSKRSFFPVSNHLGRIVFHPGATSHQTRIVWTVQYTPLPCMNFIVRLLVSFLAILLSNMKQHIRMEKKSK